MGRRKSKSGEVRREDESRTESPERQISFKNYKLQKFSEEEEVEHFVREVQLVLRLQPMSDAAAAGWILNAIEGQPKKELLMREPTEINAPEKIIDILLQRWGDQRTGSALTTAFLSKTQRGNEDVAQYASALKLLWKKMNASRKGDAFSSDLLKDTYVHGLRLPGLRQDMKRFLRERPYASFEEVEKEAIRWMREDYEDDESRHSAETRTLMELKAETAELKAMLLKRELAIEEHHMFTPTTNGGRRRTMECWWCKRAGHKEAECYAKKEYQERRRRLRETRPSHQGWEEPRPPRRQNETNFQVTHQPSRQWEQRPQAQTWDSEAVN